MFLAHIPRVQKDSEFWGGMNPVSWALFLCILLVLPTCHPSMCLLYPQLGTKFWISHPHSSIQKKKRSQESSQHVCLAFSQRQLSYKPVIHHSLAEKVRMPLGKASLVLELP